MGGTICHSCWKIILANTFNLSNLKHKHFVVYRETIDRLIGSLSGYLVVSRVYNSVLTHVFKQHSVVHYIDLTIFGLEDTHTHTHTHTHIHMHAHTHDSNSMKFATQYSLNISCSCRYLKIARRKHPDCLVNSCKCLSVNRMPAGLRLLQNFFSFLQLLNHNISV